MSGSKSMKNVQWSMEETNCLLSVWASPEFQLKMDDKCIRKSKLYAELVAELAKEGFNRTADQIINKLKKLKSDYRDAKKELSKSGAGTEDVDYPFYDLMDSALGHRPANQLSGCLNSSTAMLDPVPETQSNAPPSPTSLSRCSTPNEDGGFFNPCSVSYCIVLYCIVCR